MIIIIMVKERKIMHFGGGGFHGGGGWGGGRRNFMSDEEKAKVPKITKELVFRAFKYLLPYWKQLSVVMLTIAAAAALGVVPSILTGRMINEGLISRDFEILWQLIVASFAIVVVANLIGVLESYLTTWISQHIVFDMRNEMYRHLEFMSHKFYTTEKQGDIITRMTGDIGGVQGIISGTLTNIFRNVFNLAATIGALFSINWLLALVGITIIPLFILPTKIVGRKRFEIATEYRKNMTA